MDLLKLALERLQVSGLIDGTPRQVGAGSPVLNTIHKIKYLELTLRVTEGSQRATEQYFINSFFVQLCASQCNSV